MGTVTQYPNGQTLVSNALTISAINDLIQSITCGMLGIDPVDPEQVRCDWQIQGQPFQDPTEDICYILCTPRDGPYSKIRDMQMTQSGSGANLTLTENWGYTRIWRIRWTFYGPNGVDRARMVWSAMFMEYFTDRLSLSNLFPVSEFEEPVRVPEEFNAQWWDRSDFEVEIYEAITETINDGVVTNVQIDVENDSGQVAQFTVSE